MKRNKGAVIESFVRLLNEMEGQIGNLLDVSCWKDMHLVALSNFPFTLGFYILKCLRE